MDGNRKPNGTFKSGHPGGPGRPKRPYSITSELIRLANEPISVDDAGIPITGAMVIARWLLNCVVHGIDGPFEINGAKFNTNVEPTPLSWRERHDAFNTLINRTEPNADAANLDEPDDPLHFKEGLKSLSSEELDQLDHLMSKAIDEG